MKTIFLYLLNGSIVVSLLIVLVLLVRLMARKAPKNFFCLLWAVVGLRLILPFSLGGVQWFSPADTVPAEPSVTVSEPVQTASEPLTSAASVPSADTPAASNVRDRPSDTAIQEHTASEQTAAITNTQDRPSNAVQEHTAPDTTAVTAPTAPAAAANSGLSWSLREEWLITIVVIWLAGMGILLLYAAVMSVRLHRRIKTAIPLRDNIYQCDAIDSPFIFGMIRPKIYLPMTLDSTDLPYVLAHEQAHLSRRDYLTKPLAFLLLTVHWLNPLVWAAFVLFSRDVELACDEKVLREHDHYRKDYSMALINCSVPRDVTRYVPLAFGEVAVKSRIQNILRYRKPKRWTLVLCAVLVLTLTAAACTVPNPVQVQEDNGSPSNVSEPEEVLNPFDWDSPDIKQTIIERMKAEADAAGRIELRLWCAGDDRTFEKTMIERFQEYFAEDGLSIEVNISAKSAGDGEVAYRSKRSGSKPDVFVCYGDEIPSLAEEQLIAPVEPFYADNVKAENDPETVTEAKFKGTLYAYPQVYMDGLYLFYDKSVFSYQDIASLDAMIEKAAFQKKPVCMNLCDSYNALPFLLAAGCDVHWDSNTQVQTVTLNTQEGLCAMEIIRDLCKSAGFRAGSSANPLIPASSLRYGYSAVITGTWLTNELRKTIPEENFGVAKLPTIIVNGEQRQMISPAIDMVLCVGGESKAPFTAQTLAYFLCREEAQRQRYELCEKIPSNQKVFEELQDNGDPIMKAAKDQKPYVVPLTELCGSVYWQSGIDGFCTQVCDDYAAMTDTVLRNCLADWAAAHKDDPSLVIGDTLPETVPTVVGQYHTAGEPFENIEYDTMMQLTDMEYQILYGGLSDTDMADTYQKMYQLIDDNSIGLFEMRGECRSRIEEQQKSGTKIPDPDVNQKVGIEIVPTTEEGKKLDAFQRLFPSFKDTSDIAPYKSSLSRPLEGFQKYIAEAFLSPAEEYATLEEFAPYLFDESKPQVLNQDVLGKPYYIGYYPHSGLPDYYVFSYFLKGKNEWVSLHSERFGNGRMPGEVYYHKLVGEKVYTQIIYSLW